MLVDAKYLIFIAVWSVIPATSLPRDYNKPSAREVIWASYYFGRQTLAYLHLQTYQVCTQHHDRAVQNYHENVVSKHAGPNVAE